LLNCAEIFLGVFMDKGCGMTTNNKIFKFVTCVLIWAILMLNVPGERERKNIHSLAKATLSPSLQIAQSNFNVAAYVLYQEKTYIVQSLPGYEQEHKIEQILRESIRSAQRFGSKPINVSVKLSEVPLPKYILFFLGRRILAGVIDQGDFYTMYLTPYLLHQSETEIRAAIAHELAHVIRQDKKTELILATLIENISFISAKVLLVVGFMAKNIFLLLFGMGAHCFWLACFLIVRFQFNSVEEQADLIAEKILSQSLPQDKTILPGILRVNNFFYQSEKKLSKKKNLSAETEKNEEFMRLMQCNRTPYFSSSAAMLFASSI